MEKRNLAILSILIIGVLVGSITAYAISQNREESDLNEKIGIVVTIPPQAEFAEKVKS